MKSVFLVAIPISSEGTRRREVGVYPLDLVKRKAFVIIAFNYPPSIRFVTLQPRNMTSRLLFVITQRKQTEKSESVLTLKPSFVKKYAVKIC